MKPFSALLLVGIFAFSALSANAQSFAEIRVVDSVSGRGVPLVELETVNGLKFVTDNAGRIVFLEPGLMDKEIFFTVRSHGYEVPKDGFGFRGVKITPTAGRLHEIKIDRKIIAERLCRLTGEGRYRDTVLLGRKPPLDSTNPGKVAGQDSVQATVYKNKVYWLWGDTSRLEYPLGLFRTAGAVTAIPDGKADLTEGIAFDYFVDKKTEFARAMMPLPERPEGVIWIFGVFVVPNEKGIDKLVGHYSRRKGLENEYEQGIAVFNDEKAIFEPVKELPLKETWRRPHGHPIHFEEGEIKWLLFGSPTPNVRVPATLKDVLDPDKYEAFTCEDAKKPKEPELGNGDAPVWRWQKELPPTDCKTEQKWIKDKKLVAAEARFFPADANAPNDRIALHSGSVRWNEYRKCWVMLAGQIGGKSSHLGEVWYAEATHPTGPFTTAVKVLTHDRQTFYNVVHHSFLDRDGGRTIHFEGTYTNDFSGNPEKTPRYNYNQMLYRMDLGDAGLKGARVSNR